MKNKYDDAIREAFLKSAFEEAARQDIAELEALDINVKYPTKKQKREIEREIRKVERASSRGFSRFGRAVAMIAIVCCLVFGAVMTQPAVRASVWDVVVSFFEKYLSFDFDAEEPEYGYNLGDYEATYVPEGFNLEETQSNPLKVSSVFKNGDVAITISIYSTPLNITNIDVETSETQSMDIGDLKGYFTVYNNSTYKELTWGNDTHTFFISSTISKDEIIKIAKSIQ